MEITIMGYIGTTILGALLLMVFRQSSFHFASKHAAFRLAITPSFESLAMQGWKGLAVG